MAVGDHVKASRAMIDVDLTPQPEAEPCEFCGVRRLSSAAMRARTVDARITAVVATMNYPASEGILWQALRLADEGRDRLGFAQHGLAGIYPWRDRHVLVVAHNVHCGLVESP